MISNCLTTKKTYIDLFENLIKLDELFFSVSLWQFNGGSKMD